MQTNTEKLNEKLFETINLLLDKESPMDVTRAVAISKAAKVIVEAEKNQISLAKIKLRAAETGHTALNQ